MTQPEEPVDAVVVDDELEVQPADWAVVGEDEVLETSGDLGELDPESAAGLDEEG